MVLSKKTFDSANDLQVFDDTIQLCFFFWLQYGKRKILSSYCNFL